MDEYINKDELLKFKADVYDEDGHVLYAVPTGYIVAMLPADVAQVRHGRWICAPLCGNDNCRCSECGSWNNIHANLRGEIMQKYCPNCGAKMDGGTDNNGNSLF